MRVDYYSNVICHYSVNCVDIIVLNTVPILCAKIRKQFFKPKEVFMVFYNSNYY